MNLSKGLLFLFCTAMFFIMVAAKMPSAYSSSSENSTNSDQVDISESTFFGALDANSFSMEATFNKDVKKYVKKYVGKDRVGTELLLGRQTIYFPIINQYIDELNLPKELKNVPIIESSLIPTAQSKVGARGLWQFMPATARMYGLEINDYVDERCDPVKSTIAGLSYLKDLHKRFGDWKMALASYNCGPGRVNKAIRKSGKSHFEGIKKFLPKETQEYVSKFMARAYVTENYFFHDLRPIYPNYTLQFCKIVKIHKRTSLQKIADQTGMKLKTIQKLNPSYRKGIIPPSADGNFIIIPIFGENLALGTEVKFDNHS